MTILKMTFSSSSCLNRMHVQRTHLSLALIKFLHLRAQLAKQVKRPLDKKLPHSIPTLCQNAVFHFAIRRKQDSFKEKEMSGTFLWSFIWFGLVSLDCLQDVVIG